MVKGIPRRWHQSLAASYSSLRIRFGRLVKSRWQKRWRTSSNRTTIPAGQGGCEMGVLTPCLQQLLSDARPSSSELAKSMSQMKLLCSMHPASDHRNRKGLLLPSENLSLLHEDARQSSRYRIVPRLSRDLCRKRRLNQTDDLPPSSADRMWRISPPKPTLVLLGESDRHPNLNRSPSLK